MDVNTRIDKMEEELKLVKNEIKQVLLEIQEHVLNIQNPFSTVVVTSREQPAAASAAPAAQTAVAEAPPPPPQPVPQQPDMPFQQPGMQPGAFPPGGGYPMQQGPQQAAGFGFGPYGGGPQQPPGTPPAAEPVVGGQTPQPAAQPAEFTPPVTHRRTNLERTDKFDIQDDFIPDIDIGDDALEDGAFDEDAFDDGAADDGSVDDDLMSDSGDDSWADDEVGFDDEDDSDNESEQADDMETDVAPTSRPTDAEPAIVAESPEAQAQPQLDLATLASLVQWTEQVVQRTGPEFAEALFEISEMTGRLSPDLKQTLMLLVRLLSTNVNGTGSTVSAGETVRLMAQLDGLMGNTTVEDARLLPFLLEGNLEVLSLIRQ